VCASRECCPCLVCMGRKTRFCEYSRGGRGDEGVRGQGSGATG
jgi:hypothetical protein